MSIQFLFPPPEPANWALLLVAVGIQAATLSLLWRLERRSIFPRTQALHGHTLFSISAMIRRPAETNPTRQRGRKYALARKKRVAAAHTTPLAGKSDKKCPLAYASGWFRFVPKLCLGTGFLEALLLVFLVRWRLAKRELRERCVPKETLGTRAKSQNKNDGMSEPNHHINPGSGWPLRKDEPGDDRLARMRASPWFRVAILTGVGLLLLAVGSFFVWR